MPLHSLGSAGTQPLTSEETPEPMGNPPVTVPASNPPLSPGVSDDIRRILAGQYKTHELEALSEACLDELEARGAVVHWSLTGA